VRTITLISALAFAAPASLAADAPPAQSPGSTAPRAVEHYNLDKKRLAIKGYDPVAYFPAHGGKAVKGKPEFEYPHQGARYRFASQANLDAFKADPARYEPAHGGWCSSAMADGGRKVEIDPKNFIVTDGRLFLFYKDIFSDATDYWKKDEPGATAKADDHWRRVSGEEPRR